MGDDIRGKGRRLVNLISAGGEGGTSVEIGCRAFGAVGRKEKG